MKIIIIIIIIIILAKSRLPPSPSLSALHITGLLLYLQN